MDKQQALQILGISDESPQAVKDAYKTKLSQTEALLAKAPTDALKQKYQDSMNQLKQAAGVLTLTEQQTSSEPPRNVLSQTKLADLPNAQARHSQFEEQTKAELGLQPGQVLAGRYEIREQIGSGGMGAVYKAFDSNTQKEIALKVMLPSLLKNERARERFMDEARISQQLSHPNIVNVFDVQQDGDFCFLTMELLHGQDLRQVIENQKLARQPFTVEDVQELMQSLSEGLAYAHKHTVHRDIKPENIWLCEDGSYKIMDFGIARVQSSSQRTQTGAAMGTAYYMAPEQLKGASDVDGRADQNALAVMAYEMLTGEVPAGMIEPVRDHRKDVPKGMAEAIHQGLASRPENRFDDIIAFEQSMHQGGGVSLPGFDIQKLAIPVAIMVGILLIGGLLGPGAVDLKNLLPMSQEEISRKKGLVVKSLGEIKNYQKRLDNGRKKLDSDVRDAERNDNANLQALRHWQTLTTTTIFDGDDLAELEGQLAMAELLLKENEFVAAQQGMDSVKEGYKQLWLKFNLAEKLYDAEHKAKEAQARWQKRKNTYKLTDLPEVATAQANEAQAAAQAQQGHFSEALRLWRQAEHDWAQIYSSADEKVVALDQQRKDREAELAERKRKAADAKRLAAIEVKRKEADAKAWESVKKATKYRTGRTVIPYRLYLENPDHRDYRQEAEQAIKTIEARIKAAVNSIDKSMVVIPAGSFQMGCVSGFACSDYEFPVHKVALSRFLIGSTEVTDEQWIACALAGACHFPPFHKEGRGQYPIANVSFKDITKQFIPWLNKITGKTYRLPSESEWEYAARAGSQTAFFTGTCVSSDQANYDASFGSNGSDWNKKGNCNEGLKRRGTIPVASFPPNAFGLYDTMGNVAELTADCFNKELFADYHGVPTDGSALTSGYCYYRVVRGGSYMDNARWVRSAKRNYKTPKTATISLGFRLSRDD